MERFQCGSDGIISLDAVNPRDFVACKKIGGGFLDFGAVSLGEIVDCLADAGLLSSGTQEDQGDGSLRSKPAADGSGVSVYVQLRDVPVERSSCVNACTTVDYDDNGGLVGVEILGAVEVTIDGVPVHPPQATGEAGKEGP